MVCGAGLLWTFSRSSIVALAIGLLVLAAARRRWWPAVAGVAVVAVGFGFAAIFHDIAPRTHWFASDLPYQQAQAQAKGPLPEGSGLSGTVSLGEPSIRSHLDSLRDGIRTVLHHPQGYGLGNAGTTAQRFDVKLEAGESNYTELGAETGLAGALLFIAWSLALFVGLLRTAWQGDLFAAGVAAAFTATLALAVQTDVVGVPWLAYGLWWLAGALVYASQTESTSQSKLGQTVLFGISPGVGERARVRAIAGELPLERLVGDGQAIGVVLGAGDVVAGDAAADPLVRLDRARGAQLDRAADPQLVAVRADAEIDRGRPHVDQVARLAHPRQAQDVVAAAPAGEDLGQRRRCSAVPRSST